MPVNVARELERVHDHVERVQLHLQILSAMRFLDCWRAGGDSEECLGIYRLTPKPPPKLRAGLKSVLNKGDYAALSRAWRTMTS